MAKTFKNINRAATLQCSFIEDGYWWNHDNVVYDGEKLNKEGNVVQVSIMVETDGGEQIIKITRQFPLNYYIDNDGNYIETKAPKVSPFLITVYSPEDNLKTVYKVVKVEEDVEYQPSELGCLEKEYCRNR